MKLLRSEWSPLVEQRFSRITWSADYHLAHVKNEIEEGFLSLHEVFDDNGKGIAHIACRIDDDDLVVVAMAGNPGFNFMRYLPLIENLTQELGCQFIRAHVQDDRLTELYLLNGFTPRELVLEKKV